jgi:peptidoglycan/LPS O-acetylase OafA/YrhL
MQQPRIDRIEVRSATTFLYVAVCALEIRGYLLARAGQTALDVPRSWVILAWAFWIWFCWAIFKREYKKNEGIVPAIGRTVLDGVVAVAGIRKIVMGWIGSKILNPPDTFRITCYAVAVVFFVVLLYWPGKNGDRPNWSDRFAGLMAAAYFATRVAMGVTAPHDALLIKGIGCAALAVGAILMVLGLLNALSPEMSEFPATQNAFSEATPSGGREP